MKEPKRIAIIGSTGSIGTQTLDVVCAYPHLFKVQVLAAGRNVELLAEQCHKFRPAMAIIADESKYSTLKLAVRDLGIETASGAQAMADATGRQDVDMVVTATVGYSGLEPTLRAIRAGKDIALANKETLVVAGELVNRMLCDSKSKIIPVDSEHSAIYQCLAGEDKDRVNKLVITASGGPFRSFPIERLATVGVEDALRHPNWKMGAKITIDSATMLNKAFEIIEAHWLFGIPASKIEAVVHPQSIIHSMVEFVDGALKAQLGVPDMHLPISYALAGGVRLGGVEKALAVSDYAHLTFEAPDTKRFPCITLAHKALEEGGNTACIINAANEIAVAAFLKGKLPFQGIYTLITDTLGKVNHIENPSYEDYVETNRIARAYASEAIK